MNVLSIELRKEKRTGVIPVLLAVGVLGAAYAFVNFLVRKDTLLNLPLAPMDVLLTQLYGVIMILNLFGIVVATCMIYNMEFKGSAIKKMYMLPYECSGHVPVQISDSDGAVFDCNRTAKFSTYADRHNRLAGRDI